MTFYDTGVKCPPRQFDALKIAVSRGWQNGDVMIVFSVAEGIRKDEATVDAQSMSHELALLAGLPEFEGYYGIDNDGLFLSPKNVTGEWKVYEW